MEIRFGKIQYELEWEIVIQTFFKGVEKDYTFKHRGIFKDSFMLSDQEGNELLVMKPHLKWSN